jgi:hypothetical protein
MRHIVIAALCGAAILITGCNKNAPANNGPAANIEASANAATDYYKVLPGPVPDAKLSALSGTFQLLKVSAADGIPSDDKRGGACLVFAAADLPGSGLAGKTCSTNLECQSAGVSAGYCGPEHKCWARPLSDPQGDKTCNRPITMSPNVRNPVPIQPVDAGALGVKAGAQVRVVACLNKTGWVPGPKGTGCPSIDGADRMEVMGEPAKVHP